MNLSVGIVGLPNVGKSTLFNALLKKQQALAANYPFATIEPNVGIVPVPDERLNKLAEITKEEEKMSSLPPIKNATVEFVDIAGLVKGASQGEGLGNTFLSHIREVQIIVHVVRGFNDPNVIRYEEARPLTPERSDGARGSVDPVSDYRTIQAELLLADLQTLTKAKEKVKKATPDEQIIDKLYAKLDQGTPARDVELTEEEKIFAQNLFLITMKKELVVVNVSEEDYAQQKTFSIEQEFSSLLVVPFEQLVVICAKVEEEMAGFSEQEQKEYLIGLGLKESGLEQLIRKAYQTLGLISFLTAGVKEVKAWTIKKGMTAQMASGEIHTDFIQKFIKAEVVSFIDFVHVGGFKKARELGKTKLEGREYIMQDGDVVEFKIGS